MQNEKLSLTILWNFFTLAFSFSGLILSSNNILGSLQRTTETLDEEGKLQEGEELFPQVMPGLAKQGNGLHRDGVYVLSRSAGQTLVLEGMLGAAEVLVHRFLVIILHKIASCWEPCEQVGFNECGWTS